VLPHGALVEWRDRTVAGTDNTGFELSILGRVENESFLVCIQSKLDIFAVGRFQLTDLIEDNCFIVSAIRLLVYTDQKVHIKVMNS